MNMPPAPTNDLYPYRVGWSDEFHVEGAPYFLVDFALWGTWRITWWMGLN